MNCFRTVEKLLKRLKPCSSVPEALAYIQQLEKLKGELEQLSNRHSTEGLVTALVLGDQAKVSAILATAHDSVDQIVHRVGKVYVALGEEVPAETKPHKPPTKMATGTKRIPPKKGETGSPLVPSITVGPLEKYLMSSYIVSTLSGAEKYLFNRGTVSPH